jgi:hypothetical protein
MPLGSGGGGRGGEPGYSAFFPVVALADLGREQGRYDPTQYAAMRVAAAAAAEVRARANAKMLAAVSGPAARQEMAMREKAAEAGAYTRSR